MSNSITQFSNTSVNILRVRELDKQDISGFADILRQANEQNESAKDFLRSLSPDELRLVQRANSIADPIQIDSLSTEGAENLLSQPDGSDLVDLNNDGIIEVGAAKTFRFPPVNAPASVKAAWEKATAGLSELDKSRLELTMHDLVYGLNSGIPGTEQKTPLPPEQQWNSANIRVLEDYARSNLEFRVGYQGWTPYNQQLQDFYNNFFTTLGGSNSSSGTFRTSLTITEHNASTAPSSSRASEDTDSTAQSQTESAKSKNLLKEINQLILDARLGIDREKIKELEEKIEAVRNDDSLSPEQKSEKVQALQKQIEQLIEEARKRAVEEEKRKTTLQATITMQKERLKLI